MKKIAVFVEGNTELIFVRELLLRMYDYQNVLLERCLLRSDNLQEPLHVHGTKDEPNYYLIIDVGGDGSVLSAIVKREKDLFEKKGYSKIIGLRDMFGEMYCRKNNDKKTINWDVINHFKEKTKEQIDKIGNDKIHFFFAIMETEAWLLGIKDIFLNIGLTNDFIKNSHLKYDLDKNDPEKTYYHPAKVIGEIFKLAEREYGKNEKSLYSLIPHDFPKEKYEELKSSGHCSVFAEFAEVLLGEQCIKCEQV
ncbi:hypothetical protein Barb4_03176 [Bacteroidales bacterium Barb4]|nr:hypothetical protein Barb4_03176 [Bacteroidales bacterium Barb4]